MNINEHEKKQEMEENLILKFEIQAKKLKKYVIINEEARILIKNWAVNFNF